MDAAFFRSNRTGDIMTRMSSDLSQVRTLVGQGIFQGARTLFVFTFAFVVMFAISVPLALVLLVLLPSISCFVFLLLRIARPRYEAGQQQFSVLSNFAQERFAGIRTIKGYALESRQAEMFADINHEFVRRQMALSRIDRPAWPLMAFLFGLGHVVILVGGGRLVLEGRLTLGEMVQFDQYLMVMGWPMMALGWTLNLLMRGRASWGRIQQLLEARPAIEGGLPRDGVPEDASGDVVFDNVALTLDDRPVLEDINLTIPEGSTVGITGPTGSGKTLLASLLVRLVDPTRGAVKIGGHDIRTYPLETLRRAISIAPQEPFLFSDTLAHNIAFGLETRDETALRRASDIAQLTPDVDLFPDRFETVLGEGGVTLSGGQRQRAAISRAVAREAPILVLDDVLSAVDTQTEAQILARLRDVVRERTSVIISHRVSALRNADTIVVIENGGITQQGSHAELLSQPGYYRELEEIQRLEAELEATS
jgi:ATP-binding cassette subfamily B protein